MHLLGASRNMRRIASIVLAILGLGAFSGCGLNDVYRVPEPGYPSVGNRSIVVFGAAVEGSWPWKGWSLSFSEYDMQKQSRKVNCWRWNKIDAVADNTSREMQYFVFDVAPGFYVGGPGNFQYIRGQPSHVAFEVPAGRLVYLGDFVYATDQWVDLRYGLNAAMAALKRSHPNVAGDAVIAKVVPVLPLRYFWGCGP